MQVFKPSTSSLDGLSSCLRESTKGISVQVALIRVGDHEVVAEASEGIVGIQRSGVIQIHD